MMVMEVENLNAPRPKRLLVLVIPVLSYMAFRLVYEVSQILYERRYVILGVVGDVLIVLFVLMVVMLFLKRPDAY